MLFVSRSQIHCSRKTFQQRNHGARPTTPWRHLKMARPQLTNETTPITVPPPQPEQWHLPKLELFLPHLVLCNPKSALHILEPSFGSISWFIVHSISDLQNLFFRPTFLLTMVKPLHVHHFTLWTSDQFSHNLAWTLCHWTTSQCHNVNDLQSLITTKMTHEQVRWELL